MTWFQIFFPIFLFALQISGHSQHFDIASKGIVVTGPDAIVIDVLAGIRQGGNNRALEFRCELRH